MKNPYLIEASVEETTNFLRCMAYLALKIRNDAAEDGAEVDLTPIEAKVESWRKAAQPFLKRYAINEVAFNNALKMARANNPQFRNVAKSFRDKLAAKESFNKLKADFRNITDPQKSMISDLAAYLNSMSEPSFQRTKKNIGILNDGTLGLGFNPDTLSEDDDDNPVGGQDSALKAIKQATKSIKPSSGTPFLTFTEVKALAEKNPAAAEKYKAAYKELSDTFKAALKVVVLKSGERYMPVGDAIRELKKRGINYNLFAKGADHPNIYVNELGQAGTQGNIPIKGNPSLIVPTLIVTPNPAFDPETQTGGYVFRHTQSDSGKAAGFQQKAYSAGQAKQSAAKKSGMVNDLMKNLPNYRKKWRDDLDVDESLHQIVSTITELVYLTAARVQAQGGTSKGESTFGVQSWQVRHVKKLDDKSVSFVFPAKSGKIQNPVISIAKAEPEDRRAIKQVLANLKTFIKGKKPDEPLFSYKNKKLPPNALRQYLGSIGVKATPHKFRHARGNNIFLKEIAKSELKPGVSQTEANKFFKDVMGKVGESLGHMAMDKEGNNIPTGATAMRYYVDPELMGQFFTNLGLRPPPVVVDRMGDGSAEDIEPEAPTPAPKRGRIKTQPEPEPEEEEEFDEEPDYEDDPDEPLPGEDDEYTGPDYEDDEDNEEDEEVAPPPPPVKPAGKRGRPPKVKPAPAPEPEPEEEVEEVVEEPPPPPKKTGKKPGKKEPEAPKPIGKGDVIELNNGKKFIILDRVDLEKEKYTKWTYTVNDGKNVVKDMTVPTTGPESLDARAKKVGFIELPDDDDEDEEEVVPTPPKKKGKAKDPEPEFDEEDDDDADVFDDAPAKKPKGNKAPAAKPAPRRRPARYNDDD